MRPAAQVGEGPVTVERDHRAVFLGQVADDLDLQPLVGRFQLGQRGVAILLVALEWQVRGDLGSHLLLDRLQVGRGQRARQVEVVVEAVLDGRTDPQPCVGKQFEHGRRHDVRRRMAHRIQVVMGAGVQQLGRGRADLVSIQGHGSLLDRFERFERLAAARAMVNGPAQGRTERILEGRLPRAAIRTRDRRGDLSLRAEGRRAGPARRAGAGGAAARTRSAGDARGPRA